MTEMQRRWFVEIGYMVAGCVLVLLTLRGYDAWVQYRIDHQPTMPLKDQYQVGSLLALEGVDFSRSPINLMLVSSPVCKYCQASEHFHSKLLEMAKAAGVPFFIVVPSRKTSSQYLRVLGANDSLVKEYSQMNGAVGGTPTILGIDNTGRVKAVWAGLATPSDEDEIARMVHSRSFSVISNSTRINAPDFQTQDVANLKKRTSVEIIDVAEREAASYGPDSINIPLLELPFRADHELSKAELQVVDCTKIVWVQCKSAVDTLKQQHFNTATLGAGTYHSRCQITPLA
jgi:hypothetical protein